MTDDRRCGEDMAHDEKTCGFNCGEGIGKPATLDGAREAFKAMEATVVKELRSDKATFVPCIDCGGEGSHYEGCALRTSEVTREPVPTEVHERGWQWRPVGDDGAFAPPFGTVRACRVCDCLVAGGPTVCGRCANDGDDRNADHAAAEIERAERVSAEAIPQRDIYDDCAQDLQVILTESGNLTTLAVNAGMATAPALDIRDRIGGAVSRMTHKLHAHVTTPRRESDPILKGLHTSLDIAYASIARLEKDAEALEAENERLRAVADAAKHAVDAEMAYRREAYPGLSGARRNDLESARSYRLDLLENALAASPSSCDPEVPK